MFVSSVYQQYPVVWPVYDGLDFRCSWPCMWCLHQYQQQLLMVTTYHCARSQSSNSPKTPPAFFVSEVWAAASLGSFGLAAVIKLWKVCEQLLPQSAGCSVQRDCLKQISEGSKAVKCVVSVVSKWMMLSSPKHALFYLATKWSRWCDPWPTCEHHQECFSLELNILRANAAINDESDTEFHHTGCVVWAVQDQNVSFQKVQSPWTNLQNIWGRESCYALGEFCWCREHACQPVKWQCRAENLHWALSAVTKHVCVNDHTAVHLARRSWRTFKFRSQEFNFNKIIKYSTHTHAYTCAQVRAAANIVHTQLQNVKPCIHRCKVTKPVWPHCLHARCSPLPMSRFSSDSPIS